MLLETLHRHSMLFIPCSNLLSIAIKNIQDCGTSPQYCRPHLCYKSVFRVVELKREPIRKDICPEAYLGHKS